MISRQGHKAWKEFKKKKKPLTNSLIIIQLQPRMMLMRDYSECRKQRQEGLEQEELLRLMIKMIKI
jgi:hypothetical protein